MPILEEKPKINDLKKNKIKLSPKEGMRSNITSYFKNIKTMRHQYEQLDVTKLNNSNDK